MCVNFNFFEVKKQTKLFQTMSEPRKTSQSQQKLASPLEHIPIELIIHICQLLPEKDVYRFEQTCTYVRKAAINPNAIPSISTHINIFDPSLLNKYTQTRRYNEIHSIAIDFSSYGFQSQQIDPKSIEILPSINTFRISVWLIFAAR